MANTHTMRFTALPNGLTTVRESTFPVVSTHAAFRLIPDQPEGVLGDFPAALAWPSQALTFELTFGRGAESLKVPAVVVSPAPDLATWARIFRPDLAVRRYEPPWRKQRRIRTFRNGRLAERWRSAYVDVVQAVGPASDHLPVGADPSAGLLAGFEAAGLWDEDRSKEIGDEELSDQLEAALNASGFVADAPPGGLTPEQVARRDLLEFRRFLTRELLPDPPDTGAEPGDRTNRVSWVRAPQLEFHEATTTCAAHPSLLRALGFVHDLVPDASWAQIGRSLGGFPDSVSVVVTAPTDPNSPTDPRVDIGVPAFLTEPSPWTRCRSDDATFTAAPAADGDLTVARFLRLGDPTRYRAEILDVEATTLKAIGVGGTIQLRHRRRSRSTPDRETTPTMRASGIGILRTDRARRMHQVAFQRGDALVDGMATDPQAVVLHADDVLRGYRLDVLPEGSAAWTSLVRRTGVLDVSDGGAPIDLGDTEGWVSDGPASDDAGDLYLGEEQFRWDGWSLVAPKPGRVIDPEDGVGEQDAGELPGLPIVARYRPTPGSLVPLRYGRRYRFRARAVDIAGNGPAPSETSKPDEETQPVLFGRLDPVGSPDVVMTAPRLPGEELHRVVMRTIRRELDAEGIAGRHLLPPRTTVVEAERHGVLDAPDKRPDPARYAELVSRDAYGIHLDPLAQLDPGDPNGAGSDGPDEGASRFVPLESGWQVGYLPDPLARWLQLRRPDGTSILPGALADTGIALAGPNWPADARPVQLIVKEANTSGVDWSESTRQLVVYLPKAESLDLRLSSGFGKEDLVTFALAEWVARKAVPNAPDWPASVDLLQGTDVGTQIREGRNWVFTPWQRFTLVHAVKDPLINPAFAPTSQFSIGQRVFGSTVSSISFPARWHGSSTGRLDLIATWTEGIDDGPGAPPPRQEVVSVVAAELERPKHQPGPDGVIEAPLRARHDHGDTRHRRIDYRLEATGAFLDNFVETRKFSFGPGEDSVELDGIDVTGIALGTVRLSGRRFAAPVASFVTFRREGDVSAAEDEPVAYRLTSQPGTTTAKVTRIGDVLPRGVELTLRFVTNPISHRSTVANRNVFASTRPLAPEVHSVIPTFGWDRTRSGGTITSTRSGAGVRIWLERPWWSSGLDEQLAVLYRTGTAQPTTSQSRFVTQWGRDPVHAASNVRGSLTDAAFPSRLGPSVGLRPPGGPIVRAVPHEVHFDADRDKWYCDVDLVLGSYWPFVRLAVARWQPNAIVAADPPGTPADSQLSLSPVVLADIVQLAPGRTASVSVTGRRLASVVRVALQGQRSVNSASTVVEAHVERQLRSRRSDVDWERVTDTTELEPVTITVPVIAGTERREGTMVVAFPRPGEYRYRVVVEEYERYRTDGSASPFYTQRVGRRLVARLYPRDGRRLVHLDVIPVTGLF